MMELHKEPVQYRYPGALTDHSFPDERFYDVRLRLQHEAGRSAPSQLRAALGPFGGTITTRTVPFYGRRLRAREGKVQLRGRVTKDHILLRLDHRIKGKDLTRLVSHLATIRGAARLEIAATIHRFLPPYSDVGPCTPCAAGRFPSRRA